ncbi:PREDICTED: uncharacterized protein LOC109189157 isoform X2 [Ipomoea nil]|uniref:uncharacterized protein LOC109189157 isoform X2 n=1 Tax=Ipomoea nil TaxID=35883 RepID=UPI000901EC93|nr:PREDICTED: uncharacterized protein LOC109189157 isoform X2 [Ipomoea nil]
MGGICSKDSENSVNPYASRGSEEHSYSQKQKLHRNESPERKSSEAVVPPAVPESMSKEVEEQPKDHSGYSSSEDELYDGIPRYRRSRSQKSRSRRVAKEILESVGLDKAVEVFDTFGSGGFVSGATNKGNELLILSFEVANTIVKGSNLMQSLSKRSICHLRDVVLLSEGVQNLVSTDMDELLSIVALDKREELKVLVGEVVRFGNRCKAPQWHNLDLFFEKCRGERTPKKQLREEAELVMQQLLVLVQCTAELYHELHTLDRLQQDYQLKQKDSKFSSSRKDDGLSILAAEFKSQKKEVRSLKKKSLWSRSLEEIMEKLVDLVLFLNQEINNAFGSSDDDRAKKAFERSQQRLGPAGLALHYANIILQIDSIVARSSSMPPDARNTLYQSLPTNIKSSLRSKLQHFHVKEKLTVVEIKAEMEKTLHWLVPVATSTAKAHHGFGWVGEWVNSGSDKNRRAVVPTDVMQIETLHYAEKQKTDAYLIDLLLWLNHLISQSKAAVNAGNVKPSIKPAIPSPFQEANQLPLQKDAKSESPDLCVEDQETVQKVSNEELEQGMSMSQDMNSVDNSSEKLEQTHEISSYSGTVESNELSPANAHPLNFNITDFDDDTEKKLDATHRVDTVMVG